MCALHLREEKDDENKSHELPGSDNSTASPVRSCLDDDDVEDGSWSFRRCRFVAAVSSLPFRRGYTSSPPISSQGHLVA